MKRQREKGWDEGERERVGVGWREGEKMKRDWDRMSEEKCLEQIRTEEKMRKRGNLVACATPNRMS